MADSEAPRPSGGVSPLAVTIDAGTEHLTTTQRSEDSLSSVQGVPVAVIEGSTPELSHETNVLLRARLRAAALFLSVGYAVFLVAHAYRAEFTAPAGLFLFSLHVATVAMLAAVGGMMCRHCDIPLRWLRASELVIFGMPVLFFMVLGYYLIEGHLPLGYFDFQPGPWLVLMFVYAMFIPNTWRRAAVVIGAIAVTPLVLVIAIVLTDPRVADVTMIETWTRLPLMLGLTWAGSVFGVYTIGTLRREAFEARQLGQYRLKRRIGAGGMGEVYLAEHQLMKRPCVIKLIRPDKAGDARTLARFQREVRATAKLSHWNTVEIFDYGSTERGTFYYVMEYLPGMSLAELVERFGPMPPARVVHLLWQTCDALGEAHAAGLIHRDIKPGNIFAAHRGGVYDVAKLLDFGLVTRSDDEQPVQLTTEGAITGSPLFMSPEQAIGDGEPDGRSDIYSLGAVGYFLLTGHPPFEADKAIKVMIAHVHEEVVPPSKRGVDVPEDLELVILRCLAKKPADRYQDAASLADALAGCQSADRWSRADARTWWEAVQE
ncbi:MAG: serine/threonine-protein kinase [Planctomycetia bacterium]|nr:serine/threonine-protein kinase [Planctomycetia bacterium]